MQASDDQLLKIRIDHHNQKLYRLINRLFPIIGTSVVDMSQKLVEIEFYIGNNIVYTKER